MEVTQVHEPACHNLFQIGTYSLCFAMTSILGVPLSFSSTFSQFVCLFTFVGLTLSWPCELLGNQMFLSCTSTKIRILIWVTVTLKHMSQEERGQQTDCQKWAKHSASSQSHLLKGYSRATPTYLLKIHLMKMPKFERWENPSRVSGLGDSIQEEKLTSPYFCQKFSLFSTVPQPA